MEETNKQSLICDNCRREFLLHPANIQQFNFCSLHCREEHYFLKRISPKMTTKKCVECEESFVVKDYPGNKSTQRLCQECSQERKKNLVLTDNRRAATLPVTRLDKPQEKKEPPRKLEALLKYLVQNAHDGTLEVTKEQLANFHPDGYALEIVPTQSGIRIEVTRTEKEWW